ncbi:hypothetical protein EKO04_009810 [Ascochyta lentis]|uniref:Uncharacterized protein n=1 Tax=Ascochyta lentis TaxID=205686 RepID=A0A8H7IWX9_9PLEO|nr:hypothetical protein EKO04_009810 [Ascochyta lentis]
MSGAESLSNTNSHDVYGVSAIRASTHNESALIDEDEQANADTGMPGFAGHTNDGNLTPEQQLSSFSTDPTPKCQALCNAWTRYDPLNGNDTTHEENVATLLYQARASPSKHNPLHSINHLTTATDLDDDIRELQDATVAFLTDQYDDGDFVATQDDIIDLQEATATFLDDLHDGECFCPNGHVTGLLLPGEQFLVSTSMAVDIARATCNQTEDVIDIIDGCLGAHDESIASVLDTTDAPKFDYASFDDLLSMDSQPGSPQLSEQSEISSSKAHAYIGRDCSPIVLGDQDQQLDIYDHDDCDGDYDDELWETMTDSSDMAFDAPDALSLSQASYAASFFDTHTDTLVAYTSLDLLLAMDDDEELPCVYRALDEDEVDMDGTLGVPEVGETAGDDNSGVIVHLDDFCFDWNGPTDSSATQSGQRRLLEFVAQIPTILEEDEPSLDSLDPSSAFVNHHDCRGPGSPFTSDSFTAVDAMAGSIPRVGHLDVEANATVDNVQTDGLPQPVPPCSTILCDKDDGQYSEFFADEIWINGPNLKFAFLDESPNESVDEAELDLSAILTAVFEIVKSRSQDDIPAFGADLKQKLCSYVDNNTRDLALAERLEKIIDLTTNQMATRGRSNFTMS